MNEPMVLRVSNPHLYDTRFRVRVHWGSLPRGVSLVVGLAGVPKGRGRLNRKVSRLLPSAVDTGCGTRVQIDPSRIYRLAPAKNRLTDLPEILVPAGGSVFAVVRIQAPAKLPPGPAPQFDIVQLEANRVAGGCTVQLRTPQKKARTRRR